MRRAGRQALGAASELREAALALHGAGALPRHVRAPTMPAAATATSRSWRTRIPCWPPIASTRNASPSSATSASGIVRPAYMGLIRSSTTSSAACSTTWRRSGRARRHADHLHRRPRRLPGRPLAGREGDVLRGRRSACPSSWSIPTPRPTRRAARSMSASSRRSTSCRPCSTRSACRRNDHLVEGRSLLPLARRIHLDTWRDAVFCELDYSFREARLILKRGPRDCRAIMVRTDRWKYVWWQDFRPMLFDLANDPKERRDLGADDGLRADPPRDGGAAGRLAAARKTRVTVDDAYVAPAHRHPQEGRRLLRPVVILSRVA